MSAEGDRFGAVLTTGKPMEIDMAVEALKQAGIPYQTQEETATGLRLAMPVMPTPGPGTFFSVLVPGGAVAQAQQALSAMPFEIKTNPGIWDFGPQPAAKRGLKIYAILVVVAVVVLFVYQALRALLG